MDQYHHQQQQPLPGSQYPHSPEAYGAPVGSPPPQQQYPQQHNHPYQQQQPPVMNGHPQQPQMAYQQQPEKHDHAHAHAYPNGQQGASKFGNKWTFGFWDCFSPFSTCCFACWCPCLIFGRTYDREHGKPDSSGCNVMCCAYYCAASFCFNSCLQCIMRGQMRERYNIDSNAFNDFAGALCCPCCGLLQEEKESIVRQTGVDPTTKQAYQPVAGMNYA